MNMEWIDAENEQPIDIGWYLVCQGNNRWVRFYEMGLWVDSKEDKYGEITHWMELPEMPAKGC